MAETRLHIFGVRHHGPGSARSLKSALKRLQPDCVLIEGPPDAQDLVTLAGHTEMAPPVALLVYAVDDPQQAVFYPFAVFSPEWVAIQHGLSNNVPARFIDLPQANRLVVNDKDTNDGRCPEPQESTGGDCETKPPAGDECETKPPSDDEGIRHDPLGMLAAAAGYADGERWWDALVESRRAGEEGVFAAVADAMVALRETITDDPQRERQREAFMRRGIRAALKEGHERIAVVCGAWHVPALRLADKQGQATQDDAILKGLPKVKTAAAWVPWSYDRLAFRSGYGAGVESPEWYHLRWSHGGNPVIEWLTRAARLMRKKDLDASSAHIIEAVRLAESLAGLRGKSLPGLAELDEAALAVMCFGQEAPMILIREQLVIGRRLGAVPEDAPSTPLQQDLAALQKRLRLPVSADEKDYDLDLRKPGDLERSYLLHRLNLIKVPWGSRQDTRGKKGTFHEEWRVQWKPEYVVALIDAGRWGNTVSEAASAMTGHLARQAKDLAELARLLDHALLADLPDAVSHLMTILQERTAVSGDVLQLMTSLPPLAQVTRYGNVRQTDTQMVLQIVGGLVARICVGLPGACSSLNDDAAHEVFERIIETNEALTLLQRAEWLDEWRGTLAQLADRDDLNGLIAGRACRLLHDAGIWPAKQTQTRLSLALSTANDPAQAAAWIEGFLAGSGLLLVHDESLWKPIDAWVCDLNPDQFVQVLPLLRRTFATFAHAERRQIGEQIKRAGTASAPASRAESAAFDRERAAAVVPLIARILGLEAPP